MAHASAFIDEMGASKFYDRYYDEVKYLDFNVGYTFGRKTKITIFADLTNLLNQPLRYYQGSKDYTMQQPRKKHKNNTQKNSCL